MKKVWKTRVHHLGWEICITITAIHYTMPINTSKLKILRIKNIDIGMAKKFSSQDFKIA